jgi:Cdc6-like AAA superfamily ATPase
MWDKLGFRDNPYSTKPLRAAEEDVELLIGRDDESIELATTLESSHNGVVIVSGVPGVGKTSFLNIQMYLLERKRLSFGPKIIAARHLCPIQSTDNAKVIALRALDSILRSIGIYCKEFEQPVPKNISKIINWINQRGYTKGIQAGISLFGFGGNIGYETELPPVSEISYETIVDLINTVTVESLQNFEATSLVIVLDNIENLEEADLKSTLMTFRDTLFSIDNLYWIIIGQSGLASLIQTLDQRVFQRITSSIELSAISASDLKKAIDKRVVKFHKAKLGHSPVSESMYIKLYNSSNGEIRFVFKYCSEICIAFAQIIRKELEKIRSDSKVDWERHIGEHMINNEFKDSMSNIYLKRIVKKELDGLNLKTREKEILAKIGAIKEARAKDHKDFGVRTMQDFSSNYLAKFAAQGLLMKKQYGRGVHYELRGLSLLAQEFDLFLEE